jgi:hypothetical protein
VPGTRRRALAIAASVMLGGCSSINAQTNVFATLAEARDAGAIRRGWVPDGLPPGTYDIHEAHVPGTTERWGIFNFPQSEAAGLQAVLQPEPLALAGARADAPARIEWWPIVLRGDINSDTLQAAGIQAYRARTGNLTMAVNWKQGRAYYWQNEKK